MGKREGRRYLIWYHTWPMLLAGGLFLVPFWLVSVFSLNQKLASFVRSGLSALACLLSLVLCRRFSSC
jgi:hypothetical protein